ncbi:SRPBCC family protein [Marilutibacter spongiae]|uniref:Polyketide cyclase n=1 Tax=Marilutibacter spongiae TaxID=2025720 RepID=A0A7W3TNT6_9GAMM|nr:SRPBCC family protein [Lysobacter spongiae]MBB1061384.1 polyketide cyclase [Lysobacter spongiae]
MTRLIEILISLAIVAALFLTLGVLLPDRRHLEESVETNRKLTIVYDTINSLRRFDDWNALVLHDPAIKLELSGPESGVGARLEYTSEVEEIGTGSWEITGNEPLKSVSYALTTRPGGNNPFRGRGKNQRSTFTLTPTGRSGRNTMITQIYDVDYGWDLLGRYSGMYVASNFGQDMKLSLSRLTNMLSTVPNIDYTEFGKDDPSKAPRTDDRPAENLLVVSAAVPRENEAVAKQMKANLEWIRKVMDANNLVAAGPLRIVTNEFGSESYSFDTAMPVRKKGSGDTAAKDGDDEGEDGEDAKPVAVAKPTTDAPKLEGIKVEGDNNPVEVVYSPAGKVVAVPFTGHMANLSKVRDALRAWALTRGYETVDRPYEDWNNGVDKGFTEEGDFVVYWGVK